MQSTNVLVSLWCAVIVIAMSCEASSALTIFRFGGDPELLPPELVANPDDVTFVPIAWTDPVDEDLGGEVHQVDLRDATVKAQRYELDENIALTVEDRGGSVREGPNQSVQKLAADGDLNTSWSPQQYLCANIDAKITGTRPCVPNTDYIEADRHTLGLDSWTLELGGLFAIDRMVIVSGLEDEGAIFKNFRILAASAAGVGGFQNTSRLFSKIAEIRGNAKKSITVNFPPLERMAFVSILLAEHDRPWTAHEIEIYAQGFVDRTSYISEIIPFDQPFAWGELRWGGTVDPGAEVRIHTRSGTELEQNTYWRDTGFGEKVRLVGEDTAVQYKRLKLGERAGTTYNRDSWTFWSAPYDFADSSGTPVVSTGPRQFFQFKIDIIPTDKSGGEVEFIEFRTSEPLASELIGEVFPSQANIAELSPFTYYLQPSIAGDATGFDGLELTTSSIINSVMALRIGEVDVPLDPDDVIPLDLDGQPMLSFPANGFELNLGGRKLVAEDSGTPIEVDFDARVLRSGTAFDMRVLNTDQPLAVRQKVDAGDANNLIEGNTVSVSTTAGAESLLKANVTKVFTPNDDGTNDVASISYDLLEIIGASEVTIEISDLSGRVVKQVYSGQDAVGHYDRVWMGLDDSGDLVPPGVYLYRIKANTDRSENVAQVGVVNVAY